MRRLVLFGTGIGIGYVLGARAGRERYEQITALASQAWQGAGWDRSARRVGEHVGETARLAAQGAGDWVANGAVAVVDVAKDKAEAFAAAAPGPTDPLTG
jgi:hypothetical protein